MMITNNRKLYYRLLLAVWLLLCGYVLVANLLNMPAGADAERTELFYLEMLILTFPLGYVAGLLVGAIFAVLPEVGVEMPLTVAQYGNVLLAWLVMTATGFFQWFVWLPKLFAWIKSIWNRKLNVRRS